MADRKKPVQRSRVQSGPLKQSPLSFHPPPQPRRSGGQPKTGDSKPQSSKSSKLEYSEVKGDLFSSSRETSLAHCVSEDMAMGAGIAVHFKERFKRVGELKAQGVTTGGVAMLEEKERFIYYLVTKKRYFHKPTYESLKSSLVAMKTHCIAYDVKELAMPRIGSGLDKLSWERVSDMIQNIFGDVEMKITIYYL